MRYFLNFLLILSIVVTSCRQIDEKLSSSNSEIGMNGESKVIPSGQIITGFNNELPTCGGGGTNYPINSSYPSLDYNVVAYSYDPTLIYCGKTCKDLPHALVDYIQRYRLANTSEIIHKFYGYDSQSAYSTVNEIDGMTLQEAVYEYGQNGYNEEMYGTIFPYGTVMNPNVVNTIAQSIIQQIDNHGVGRIVAICVYTDALLCVPSYRFVRVKVKYIPI